MKIRTGFVSNSSSTSFIIITSSDLNRETFLELMGVVEDSPLIPLFDALFMQISTKMLSLDEYVRLYGREERGREAQIEQDFGLQVVERVAEAENNGFQIYVGRLSSDDGDQIEAFFCTDSFEVENDNIYLNALSCVW